MTEEERLAWIDHLQRDAGEGRERIRQRQEAREADPALEQDWLMAEVEQRDAGLVFKEHDNGALDSAPEPEPVRSYDDVVAEAIGIVAAELRREWREERSAEVAVLKQEIAELRGQVSALLALLGQKSVGKVIDLPSWWRAKDVG